MTGGPIRAALSDLDTLAVALGSRVVLWKPRTDERREQGFRLNGWPGVRLNDGRPDPRGSFRSEYAGGGAGFPRGVVEAADRRTPRAGLPPEWLARRSAE